MGRAEFSGRKDPLTEKIIGMFYEVYNELGIGFLESVYRGAMVITLRQAEFKVEAEIRYRSVFVERWSGFFGLILWWMGELLSS
jgi:PD-(D/E)XK nuclease superfamily